VVVCGGDTRQVKAWGRLEELCRLRLDDPARRPELDQLAQRVASLLDAPIALVSVALDEAQMFLGGCGLTGWLADIGGTPLEWSFCRHVVGSGREYLVADAMTDPGMRDSPLVTVAGIRSYAGVPLVSRFGFVIGALCVKDYLPGSFTSGALARLRQEASGVMDLLERDSVSST
jgi:GAF domain-containing protein